MIILRCTIHKQIKICGQWVSTEDVCVKNNLIRHAGEIDWKDEKCPRCWAEKIPP